MREDRTFRQQLPNKEDVVAHADFAVDGKRRFQPESVAVLIRAIGDFITERKLRNAEIVKKV